MTMTSQKSAVDPETQAWLDALAAAGRPPIYTLTPQDARNVLRGVQAGGVVELAPAHVEDRMVPGGPNGDVSVRIFKPADAPGTLPVIVYTHGGGWVLGDKDTHERLVRELANEARAAIVFVNYTPAPEAQYPAQIEEAYAALEWIAGHAAEIDVDAGRIGVVGDSAGGNLAAALTLMVKERRGPAIATQVLFYPVTDAGLDTGSYRQYADGPWLTYEAMRWFWDAYLPEVDRRLGPMASPLQATVEELSGLPPALIITGEHDVLRDEGEAYARKLSEAGGSVTQVRYAGAIHDFALLNTIASTPATRAAITQAGTFLRQALTS